jgi:serine/threonine protein kinase
MGEVWRAVQQFGAVDAARTVYLLQQVCHSLGEAHARGLVHRDVKPANILVCRLGPDDDFVKVLDFGLVKHAHDGQTVTVLSTEGAASERQAIGHRKSRSVVATWTWGDIYSLGCVAYCMLTSRPVFCDERPSRPPSHTCRRHAFRRGFVRNSTFFPPSMP